MSDFQVFPKVPRWSRDVVITEKIDGTNAQIFIQEIPSGHIYQSDFIVSHEDKEYALRAGSRNRYLTVESDNFLFAKWVRDNARELVKLGPGRHFGEWWGLGIQRGYDMTERRFSLFNVHRWGEERPQCCHVVPKLYEGPLMALQGVAAAQLYLEILQGTGSRACPGYMRPEGIMIYHTAARQYFKKTIEKDEKGKGE